MILILGAVVALVVLGVLAAWWLGAFAPKMSRLPSSVGAYSMDASTRTSSSAVYDSATYRAGSGDIYQADLVKSGPDPALAFAKAAADARFQSGSVYCTSVSKAGKGGTCKTQLSTGSVVSVEGSTRHTIQDLVQFTQDLAAGVK